MDVRRSSRTVMATRSVLGKQLWIWPVAAALMLSIVGLTIRHVVEEAVKLSLAENLQAILRADVEALEVWLQAQQSNAAGIAANPPIRRLVDDVVAEASEPGRDLGSLVLSDNLAALRRELRPWLAAYHYNGFVVIDRQGRVLAAQPDHPIGNRIVAFDDQLLDRIFNVATVVTRPFASAILLEDGQGHARAGRPTMFAAAPVFNAADEVIAALAVRMRPEQDFTRILSIARAGRSGEAYAFDSGGVLLSQSRFDEQLKQIGLLPDREDAMSILNIQLRDPQVNMLQGQRPTLRRPDQPLTKMAAAAVVGRSGVNVEGYRNYKGVPVVGAWTWLPDYGMGVATEVDVTEAYRPLYILRWSFWALFVLLAVSAAAIFVFTIVVARLNRAARRAALKVQKLGQYSLDEKIGAGAMGIVYRGHHSMLRRPTAIKLLDVDRTTDAAIARFEREVQLTSQLNHPNTIAVYDYGRTPEGIFYYAMEFLDGLTLEKLVQDHGRQPEGRVIHILTQVCGSLNEAHGIGLIHRDIKPANVILNQRGGMFDVVKLLDFGLVKAVDADKQATLTAASTMSGTPLYLSPEGIERPDQVDARSDLYAVGCVGYFLLTGQTVFEGQNVVELCRQHVNSDPVPPSQRVQMRYSPDIETLLLQCLAKQPEDRPQSARQLAADLLQCEAAGKWTQRDAEQWWQQTSARNDLPVGDPTARIDKTIVIDQL